MTKRPLKVSDAREAGKGDYHDGLGTGLILRVQPSGTRSWVQRLVIKGKRCELGLGRFKDNYNDMQRVRAVAQKNHDIARSGGDPRTTNSRVHHPTFREACERYIEFRSAQWRAGGKSEADWRASLGRYAYPRIGKKLVDEVTSGDVMDVLEPIWFSKSETARRVKQRISIVMKWAIAHRYRQDNPAGEVIDAILLSNQKKVLHHPMLPPSEVACALRKVRTSNRYWATYACMEFLTLTAARSGEARGATWNEMALDQAEWTVPQNRMKKAVHDHRVPLSTRAMQILDEARPYSDDSGLVFPSVTGRTLSDNTLSKALRDLKVPCVPHGMRASFRTWARKNRFPDDIAEFALSHVSKDKIFEAYMRDDLFQERREMMEAWATYLRET